MGWFSGRRFGLSLLAILAGLAYFKWAGKPVAASDFVGTWQSSRTLTPLHLAANGEWEIRSAEGAVLQYGVWRYEDKKIIWTFKQGSRIFDDANPVLSVAPKEFTLRERNGSTTLFRRVE